MISVSGSLPDIQTYTLDATNSRANMNWKPYTYTFTAFDTTSTLTFASAEKNAYGPALDNVTISAVPEPQTWGLMLAGFVMVGAASRRRKGVASLTA